MKLATTSQMRALEQAAVDAGASWASLMERAGAGVAEQARGLLGGKRPARVLVLVGPGNNGGDGLVAARQLHDAGVCTDLYLWRRAAASADANWQHCRQRAIAEHAAEADPDRAELRRLLAAADLVIDALLGMGISRPVTGDLAAIVETINQSARREGQAAAGDAPASSHLVLAVDLPTGIDSDSGALRGAAIRADLTVATGLPKRGLLQYPGRAYAGALALAEIGLAPDLLETVMSELIDAACARSLLPPRPADSYKGSYGKVLVIAGSAQYPGAASLACAAAARVGAGLVTLANGRSVLATPGRLAEVTLEFLPETGSGELGDEAADAAIAQLGGYQALLVGPGLGRAEHTRGFLSRLLGLDAPHRRAQIGFRVGAAGEHAPERARPALPPTVIDADGLTMLSQIEQWPAHLPNGRCVLTPHPGEMRRLLGADALDDDRLAVAEQAARAWGQVVVLKGATTVVAEPGGRSAVHDGGNPALATAGTGDVLAGAIAGLLAQGLAPFEAAVLGVYLHGAAGALVRDDLGDMGALASDLLPRLPLAIRALKQN